jgi:cytochrome d ubiquinol oxidase subunit I
MVGLIYYSFRIMVAIGLFLASLMAVTVGQWLRGQLSNEKIDSQKWLLRAWVFAAPLGYLAVETGWIVRCVGRQPWTVYNQIRTVDAASKLPAGEILTSLIGITAIYVVFLVSALYFGSRIIRQGPNLNLPLPGTQEEKVTSPELNPRPLEAQQ